MSYLSDLYASLSSLNTRKAQLEKEIHNYMLRKNELETIKSNIASRGDTYCGWMRDFEEGFLFNLEYGLKGAKNTDTILETVEAQREKAAYLDSDLSTADGYVDTEIKRVKDKIVALENDLITTCSQISSTSSAIRSEERRLEEERKRAEEAARQAEEAARQAAYAASAAKSSKGRR